MIGKKGKIPSKRQAREGEGSHSSKKPMIGVPDGASSSSSSFDWRESDFGDSQAPDREPYPLDCMSDEEVCFNTPEFHEILMNQTRSIAAVALDYYYYKEGVRYVLEEPVTSFCFLLDGVLVCHANFTAKADRLFDSDSGGSLVSPTPTPAELFFAETAQVIGRDKTVTCCSIMDPPSQPDSVRDGCLYCGKRTNPVFYHPRGGPWKYGCQAAFKTR